MSESAGSVFEHESGTIRQSWFSHAYVPHLNLITGRITFNNCVEMPVKRPRASDFFTDGAETSNVEEVPEHVRAYFEISTAIVTNEEDRSTKNVPSFVSQVRLTSNFGEVFQLKSSSTGYTFTIFQASGVCQWSTKPLKAS